MDTQYVDVVRPVLTDVVSFSALGLFNIYAAQIMKPAIRGFFCDDETIRYPFHSSTVPSLVLNILGIVIPIITIVFIELKCRRTDTLKTRLVYQFNGRKIPPAYWNVYKMVACYGCGAVFSQLLTDIGKKMIGRLRPNFIDVCQPDVLASGLCMAGNYSYIENYRCQNPNEKHVNDSRVSFPSGHSSFSFYVAVFLVLYLQKRLKVRTFLLKPIIQFLFILLAWFVALSRVVNNKHHWSDVLTGILLGSVVAIVNTVLVHRIFDSESHEARIANTNHTHNVDGVREAHAQL